MVDADYETAAGAFLGSMAPGSWSSSLTIETERFDPQEIADRAVQLAKVSGFTGRLLQPKLVFAVIVEDERGQARLAVMRSTVTSSLLMRFDCRRKGAVQ